MSCLVCCKGINPLSVSTIQKKENENNNDKKNTLAIFQSTTTRYF